MNNKLLGDWRLRVANPNYNIFSKEVRIHFFDAITTSDKEVYDDKIGSTSLGAYVKLDSDGYVPVSGIWLGYGAYSASVEEYDYTDELGEEHWNSLWTIPYISGSETLGSDSSNALTTFATVSEMRAFTPDGTNAFCHGYNVVNDSFGGGHFYWNALTLNNDDEGSVIKPTSYSTTKAGRWIRIFEDVPNIRQWGANESQANCKVRIVNAQDYTIAQETNLIYPKGTYALQTEVLNVKSNGIVEDNCFFDGTGDVTFVGCDIKSNHKLSNSSLFSDINLLKPEWFGAVGDGVTNDIGAMQNVYNTASGIDADVWLTRKYYFDGATTINSSGNVSSKVTKGATVIIGDTMGVFSLGEISEDGVCKDFIQGNLSYFSPMSGYKVSYYDSFSSTLLSTIYTGTSSYDLIWDESYNFSVNYADVAPMNHIFIKGSEWSIDSGITVTPYTTSFDISNFVTLGDVTRLVGDIVIYNQRNITVTLASDYTFPENITFKYVNFYGDTDVAPTVELQGTNDLKFIHCKFSSYASTTTTYPQRVEIAGVTVDVINCYIKYSRLIVASNRRYSKITNYKVINNTIETNGNRYSGIIDIIAYSINCRVNGLVITGNTFKGLVVDSSFSNRQRIQAHIGTRDSITGSFRNIIDESSHTIVITNNTIDSKVSTFSLNNYVTTTVNARCPWTEYNTDLTLAENPSSNVYERLFTDSTWFNGDGGLFVLPSDTYSRCDVSFSNGLIASYIDGVYEVKTVATFDMGWTKSHWEATISAEQCMDYTELWIGDIKNMYIKRLPITTIDNNAITHKKLTFVMTANIYN